MDTSRYKELRNHLLTGDHIGAISRTLGGRIIQFGTGGRLTHGAMVVIDEEFSPDEPERVMIGQADLKRGVHLEALSHYLEQLRGQAVWFPLRHAWARSINPEYQRDLKRAIKRDYGRKVEYDLRGALRFAFPFVGQSKEALFCTEAEGEWCQAAKLWDASWPSPSRLSPTAFAGLPLFESPVSLDPAG